MMGDAKTTYVDPLAEPWIPPEQRYDPTEDAEEDDCSGDEPMRPFPVTRADELEPSLDCHDFVEDLLLEGGASVVFGRSNVGKSFWTLDLAAHVATGRRWRFDEHDVRGGCVLYVALEGEHGMRNRISALRQAGILPAGAPFYLVFARVSLLDPGDPGRLAETVRQAAEDAGSPVKLAVIDTLSRAIAGGDENSAKDMTFAVQGIDRVREVTGAHVLLVHHSGKDTAKGSRGHSSLLAAVDTEIELHRPEGSNVITAEVTKQRDLPRADPMPFTLHPVVLGRNQRGKDVTSCTVRQEDGVMAETRTRPGRRARFSADDLVSLLPATSTKDFQNRAQEEFGMSETTFFRKLGEIAGVSVEKTLEGAWHKVK